MNQPFDLNSISPLLEIEPFAVGLQLFDAAELARDFFPRLDTDKPALIGPLASAALARKVRRTLLANYPPSHPVNLVHGRKVKSTVLKTMDRDFKFTRGTLLYLPPLPRPGSPQTLAAIVARLRAPKGCPWDREQTHKTLRRALLEETYEVIEALDENDPVKLREELGDLLLHVLFQTQIARDQSEFTLAEVGEELAAKLIRRHPHVFGEVQVASAREVIANWERIKQEEKAGKVGPRGRAGAARSGRANRSENLESNIPRQLPALARAQKVHERARRKGIQLPQRQSLPIWEDIERRKGREQELGDLLFDLAGWAQENGLDATSALRRATARSAKEAEKL